MRGLFQHLVEQYGKHGDVSPESVIAHLGARGKVYNIVAAQTATQFTDEAKTMILIRQAVPSLMKCPLCSGLLDPAKSVSYDHVQHRREGGTGDVENGRLAHPYCNSIRDWLEDAPKTASTG